jgi:hypothetical protein
MVNFEAGETIQRLAYIAGAKDSRGNPVDSWAPPVDVRNVAFDPGSTAEPRMPGHDRVVVEPTIYADYDLVLAPKDHVKVRGETYEVIGVVRRWRNPYSANKAGAVATLKKVTG